MSNFEIQFKRMKANLEYLQEEIKRYKEELKADSKDYYAEHNLQRAEAEERILKLNIQIFTLKNKEVTLENQKMIVELTQRKASQNPCYKESVKEEEEILRKLEVKSQVIIIKNQMLFF